MKKWKLPFSGCGPNMATEMSQSAVNGHGVIVGIALIRHWMFYAVMPR